MPESPIDPKLMQETRLPLAGLRVLDLTLARAGPDLRPPPGRLGRRRHPDRAPGPAATASAARATASIQNLHRNKRGFRLDLKNPAGPRRVPRLVATADIVVENMRPQVKHRLRIAYDDLKAINPRLDLRHRSPASARTARTAKRARRRPDRPGHGRADDASPASRASGPMRVGIPINDLAAGNLLAMGIIDGAL